LNSDERVVTFISHGLYITGDTAVSVGIIFRAEAAGDLLLDLGHAQILFSAIVGKRHMRVFGEQ